MNRVKYAHLRHNYNDSPIIGKEMFMEKQTKNIQIEEIDQFLKQSIESWNLKNKNNLAFAFLTRKIQYIFLHFIDVDKKYYFELLSEGRIKFSNKNQENLSQLTIQLSMQTFHSLFSRKLHPCMAYIQKDVSVTGVPLADIGLLLPIYCELISQYKIEAEIVSKLNKPPIKQNFSELYKTAKFYIGNAAVEIKKIPDNSFDVVFSIAVLIHIDPEFFSFFADMVRISKKYIAIFTAENGAPFPYNFRKIFTDLGCKEIYYQSFLRR